MSAQDIGNKSEEGIKYTLGKLRPELEPISIPNQNDSNHFDLIVNMKGGENFFVQVKTLNENELSIKMPHISDWLENSTFTVIFWWDNSRGIAYWADIIRYLLRTGGIRNRKWAIFNRNLDLHRLNPNNSASRIHFLNWVRSAAKAWRIIFSDYNNKCLLNPEFPIKFIDFAKNPDILKFLPLNAKLVTTLKDYCNIGAVDQSELVANIFYIGSIALNSWRSAFKKLCLIYNIREEDTEIKKELYEAFKNWNDRIKNTERDRTSKVLWAFDKIASIINNAKPVNIHFPAFTSKHTYPIGSLVNLIPKDILWLPLNRILETSNDSKMLQYCSYILGILNYSKSEQPWVDIKIIRHLIEKRKSLIGREFRKVHRQILYTEAQVGGEEAKMIFIDMLRNKESLRFDSIYNFEYYNRDQELIHSRYIQRMGENLKSDRNVKDILLITYDGIRKWFIH